MASVNSRGAVTPMEADPKVKPKKKAKAKSKGEDSGKGSGSKGKQAPEGIHSSMGPAADEVSQQQQATTAEQGTTSAVDRMIAVGHVILTGQVGILPPSAPQEGHNTTVPGSALLGNPLGDDLKNVVAVDRFNIATPPGLEHTVEFGYDPAPERNPGVDHTAEFSVKPFSQQGGGPLLLSDPPLTSDPLDLEIPMPTSKDVDEIKKPPSDAGSNMSASYAPAPRQYLSRAHGYQQPSKPYGKGSASSEDLLARSVPNLPGPTVQAAIDLSNEANLRAQASLNVSANAARSNEAQHAASFQHMGLRDAAANAAMAALGSVVQETVGQQSDTKTRVTAIETNAATTSQLQEFQQAMWASSKEAAAALARVTARADKQEELSERLAAQVSILRDKVGDAAEAAGSRIDSLGSQLTEGNRRTEWAMQNISTEVNNQLANAAAIQKEAIKVQGEMISQCAENNRAQYCDKLADIMTEVSNKAAADAAVHKAATAQTIMESQNELRKGFQEIYAQQTSFQAGLMENLKEFILHKHPVPPNADGTPFVSASASSSSASGSVLVPKAAPAVLQAQLKAKAAKVTPPKAKPEPPKPKAPAVPVLKLAASLAQLVKERKGPPGGPPNDDGDDGDDGEDEPYWDGNGGNEEDEEEESEDEEEKEEDPEEGEEGEPEPAGAGGGPPDDPGDDFVPVSGGKKKKKFTHKIQAPTRPCEIEISVLPRHMKIPDKVVFRAIPVLSPEAMALWICSVYKTFASSSGL